MSSNRLRIAVPVSAALHAAALAWLLATPRHAPLPAEQPPIEVELVQQDPAQQGAPQAQAAQPPAAPPSPEPPPPAESGAAPPPAQPAPPGPSGAPAVNLGDAERDLEGLVVTGDHVVPPAPDALFRNKPPSYPAEAGRRHAEGTVHLLIRVSARGTPDEVLIAGSSGTASLDRAARDAVLLWRFRPAQSGGVAVPFEYRMDIRFKIGND